MEKKQYDNARATFTNALAGYGTLEFHTVSPAPQAALRAQLNLGAGVSNAELERVLEREFGLRANRINPSWTQYTGTVEEQSADPTSARPGVPVQLNVHAYRPEPHESFDAHQTY